MGKSTMDNFLVDVNCVVVFECCSETVSNAYCFTPVYCQLFCKKDPCIGVLPSFSDTPSIIIDPRSNTGVRCIEMILQEGCNVRGVDGWSALFLCYWKDD